ncbi:hypothetical protein LCGC14_2475280 [marine sediment metagenome]|uniref:Uncharacterized protein n=1 Tax=marine sediment metagenome TaxID=412755 RepID=A0A0F9DL89_9ZZZZ
MFLQIPDITKYIPFIIAGLLLGGGVLILKLGLKITKAESRTDMKWVAGSFFIQFGVTVFISAPILLDMILETIRGTSFDYYRPPPSLMAIVIIVSILIVVNFINMIHKPGIKRSFVITLLILGPIIGSSYLIFSNIGSVL